MGARLERGLLQHEGVLLPDVDRAPLQGPFASIPGLALTEGSLRSPIPGLLPFPRPVVVLGVVPTPPTGLPIELVPLRPPPPEVVLRLVPPEPLIPADDPVEPELAPPSHCCYHHLRRRRRLALMHFRSFPRRFQRPKASRFAYALSFSLVVVAVNQRQLRSFLSGRGLATLLNRNEWQRERLSSRLSICLPHLGGGSSGCSRPPDGMRPKLPFCSCNNKCIGVADLSHRFDGKSKPRTSIGRGPTK